MNRTQSNRKPREAETPPEGGAVSADGLEQEILAELSEMRAIMARFARRLDARAETKAGQEELPQLNNAAVKTVRALRQIAVLQLEIAGKRPLPNQRGPNSPRSGAAPAGQDEPAPETNTARWYPQGYPFTRGDYTDYDDYTDYEREMLEDAKFHVRLKRMVKAMDEDFLAAGRPDIRRQAPALKIQLIYGIPHPALDRALAEVEPSDVYAVFGPENVLPPRLGTGPPGVLEAYDEKHKDCRPLES